MGNKVSIDTAMLKRKRVDEADETTDETPPSVSAGAVEKVIDYAFNPSREKIREMTIVDRIQSRLFPLLDVINMGQLHCLEIAIYRQDKEKYKKEFRQATPITPNFLDEYMFRTAQWQKSFGGKNLERAIDIALAETEAKALEEEDKLGTGDPWSDK